MTALTVNLPAAEDRTRDTPGGRRDDTERPGIGLRTDGHATLIRERRAFKVYRWRVPFVTL
jgi:hypothetical protein